MTKEQRVSMGEKEHAKNSNRKISEDQFGEQSMVSRIKLKKVSYRKRM
jgi:hypothetical protein